MSREPLNIEKQIDKAHQDSRRKYALNSMLPDTNKLLECTNKLLECVSLIGRLNEAINLLLSLQDDYYTDYIFYRQLYDDASGHEVYWHEFFEKRTRELERKLNRIECE